MPSPRRPDQAELESFFVPSRIRRMREADGMTQLQVALKMGLGASSHMTISNWELGRKAPNRASLIDLWAWYRQLVRRGKFPDEFAEFSEQSSRHRRSEDADADE